MEYDFWAAAGNEGFDANVRPMAENMTFLGDGQDVVSGIIREALRPYPGHMVYRLVSSEGAGLVIFADLEPSGAGRPGAADWEVRFDSGLTRPMAARHAAAASSA